MKNRDYHHHRSPDERATTPPDAADCDHIVLSSRDDPPASPRNPEHGQWRERLKRGAQTAAVVGHGVLRSVLGSAGEPAQMRLEPVVPPAAQSQMINCEIPVSMRPGAPPHQPPAGGKRDLEVDDEPAPERREPPNLVNRHDLGAVHSPPPNGADDPFVRPKPGLQSDAQRSSLPRPVLPER